MSDLKSVVEITLPRCLYKVSSSRVKRCPFHVLANFRKEAHCAVLYLVYETEERIFYSLVCAKTRVAHLKS